jgi:hypothetical protein
MEEAAVESTESSPKVLVTNRDAINSELSTESRVEKESESSTATLNTSTNLHVQHEATQVSPSFSSKNATQLQRANMPDMFVVDTAGDTQAIPKSQPPHIRPPSPARSDSSDEVVFHGRRNQFRVIDDPVTQSGPQIVENSTKTQQTLSEESWDDTSVEWVHRSKPGIGWTVPSVPKKRMGQLPPLTFHIQKEQIDTSEDASPTDDYLENIKLHDPDILQSVTFASREIDIELDDGGPMHRQFKSLSVSGGKKGNPKNAELRTEKELTSDSPEGSRSEAEDDAGDETIDIEVDELFGSNLSSEIEDDFEDDDSEDDEDSEGDEDDEDDDKDLTHTLDDESLARLLSKQEELGFGSDELLLFDGVDAAVSKAAKRYAKQTPKRSRRAKGDFPSATLLADVLDHDPYGGFDIMNFERPSLRKRKGKGKSTGLGLPFDISDSELHESLQVAWENDRAKKKAKKQEREELRAQGLLGGKAVNSKYGEGMTIWQIGKEFESFLASDEQEKALLPMDKRRRKMVHEIAVEFNLKTKSIGSGNSRYTKLIKTKTTTQYVENRFVARARKINMGFFPRQDAQEKGKRALRVSNRGGNSGVVRYRDGDIVGGAAPEIGAGNKGRTMLEKMGWSSGMALGAHDNKGILEPIAHIVKNSKSGLG